MNSASHSLGHYYQGHNFQIQLDACKYRLMLLVNKLGLCHQQKDRNKFRHLIVTFYSREGVSIRIKTVTMNAAPRTRATSRRRALLIRK
jgi:hypothetical protein